MFKIDLLSVFSAMKYQKHLCLMPSFKSGVLYKQTMFQHSELVLYW